MRILVVAPPWFPVPPTGYGGIEAVVALLADGLVDAGHDVTLLASGGSRTRARLKTVYGAPPSRLLGDACTEFVHVLSGYLDRDGYDVVHDHSGLVGASLAAVAGIPPVVHTLHGPWTQANAALYRLVAPRVDLVAISHTQARQAPPDIRLAGVVHNAVDLDLHRPTPDKGDELVFVGRANREKGPEVAVEVARRLGRRLVMVIKVNEDAERDYFDAVLRPRLVGVDVDVRSGASPKEKAALMARAGAVLFPVQWPEPFGLVAAEANACGTPVVAFGCGAAPEVVADGVSGVVVPPGDVDAFCAAVERAETLDPAACRAHAEERFSPQRMVEGYLDVYRAALRRAGVRRRPGGDTSPSAELAVAG